MPSVYKLTYFGLRARAEPTRIAFAYAGVEYEDKRISWENRAEEWPSVQQSGLCPFGQLPLLEVDGVVLCQSMTILRFVAKRHGLMPETDIQQAVADMFALAVNGLQDEHIRNFFEEDPARQKAVMEKFMKETIPKFCQYLEKIVEKNPKQEVFCVGNKLSYADICFFSYFNSFLGGGKLNVPDVLKAHTRLAALYKKVMDEPRIKTWLKKRPKSPL